MASVFVVNVFELHFETLHLFDGLLQFTIVFPMSTLSIEEACVIKWRFSFGGLTFINGKYVFFLWDWIWFRSLGFWFQSIGVFPLEKCGLLFFLFNIPLFTNNMSPVISFSKSILICISLSKNLDSKSTNGGRRSFLVSRFLNSWYSFGKRWNNKEKKSLGIVIDIVSN